jgi:Na+/H+ antiporter NhaD/arsenite permease-like protein
MSFDFSSGIPIWLSIPFIVMLLFIAIGPLLFEEWWESNRNKLIVSLSLGIPLSAILIFNNFQHELIHQLFYDYIPFIVLLGSLFIITGGIHFHSNIESTPVINTLVLATGGILASFMGTTGAAMLLIRPMIKINARREFKVHTMLFFIAIIANAGGMLTPLGDPPLFLLYLRGAPFMWFMNLFAEWLFVLIMLLVVYFITDTMYKRKELPKPLSEDFKTKTSFNIKGRLNFLFLLGVILSVAFINENYFEAIKHNHSLSFIREAVILTMALLSLLLTTDKLRYSDNKFSWSPITEVAFLFLGIFITMVPALLFLEQNTQMFSINNASEYFYSTGILSSFLDNAPTAVSFHKLAMGIKTISPGDPLVAKIPESILKAISTGAVFFGAMTYIGNGPNFMIKAIAEESGISMPGFFSYIFKFSILVLLPIYVISQLIFL